MSDDVPSRGSGTLTGPGGEPASEGTNRRPDVDDDVAWAHAAVRNAEVEDHLGPPRNRSRRRGWRDFAQRYGWRAYALPVLVLITVAVLVRGVGPDGRPQSATTGRSAASVPVAPPPAQSSSVLKRDDGVDPSASAVKAAALPAGAAYDTTGSGTFSVLPGHSKKVGTGRLFRYSIDVENGLTGIDLAEFQTMVDTTLADPRSWSGHGVALERVDSGPIDFHISMTTSLTVRKYCGYTVKAESSCYLTADSTPADLPGPHVNRVIIDDARWVRGASAYIGDIAQYRRYLINHEDGHAIGHNHAHECLPGGLAPAMMQQTFGLRSTLTGTFCQANPWPYPPGVSGAPGAEQPDTPANDEYGRGD